MMNRPLLLLFAVLLVVGCDRSEPTTDADASTGGNAAETSVAAPEAEEKWTRFDGTSWSAEFPSGPKRSEFRARWGKGMLPGVEYGAVAAKKEVFAVQLIETTSARPVASLANAVEEFVPSFGLRDSEVKKTKFGGLDSVDVLSKFPDDRYLVARLVIVGPTLYQVFSTHSDVETATRFVESFQLQVQVDQEKSTYELPECGSTALLSSAPEKNTLPVTIAGKQFAATEYVSQSAGSVEGVICLPLHDEIVMESSPKALVLAPLEALSARLENATLESEKRTSRQPLTIQRQYKIPNGSVIARSTLDGGRVQTKYLVRAKVEQK